MSWWRHGSSRIPFLAGRRLTLAGCHPLKEVCPTHPKYSSIRDGSWRYRLLISYRRCGIAVCPGRRRRRPSYSGPGMTGAGPMFPLFAQTVKV